MATLCTFILNERAGYARTSETVNAFVPLSEADAITAVSSLTVTESGTPIDATFTPVSRWWGAVTDTSKNLKIVRVTFRASLTASQVDAATYLLTNGGAGTTGNGITVTDGGTYYEITTGTADGSGRFRIRKTGGGGHNVLEQADVRASSAWKAVIAAANDSAVYLHGVATAEDALYAISSGVGSLATISGKTLTCTVDGVTTTVTFGALASVQAVLGAIGAAYNRGSGTIGWSARGTSSAFTNIELVAPTGAVTVTVGNGTANAILGFTNGQAFASSADGQGADYKSNAYTGGSYSVDGVELPAGNVTSLSGGETCTILVKGKFGATPFVGFHDEVNTGKDNANGTSSRNRADLSYEARYTFYRNSAYVGIDLLFKGAGGSQNQYDCGDAAIKYGGLYFVPNFSGANTKLYATCYDTTSSLNRDATLTYASGTAYAFQNYAPSGTSHVFSLSQSGFTFSGTPDEMREGWFGVEDSSADRYLVIMQKDSPKEKVPHGFRYNGTNAEITLWPTERGHVEYNYTGRSYHIFAGQWYYRWQGGVLFGSGAASASICRSAWYRYCRNPIMAHCGDKYETSKAFGDMPPAQSIVKGSDNAWYKCKLAHVASSATAPVTGGSYTTYWQALGFTPSDTTLTPHTIGRRYAVFNMADTTLDEARARHLKWRDAMLDTTLANAAHNYQWAYDNRNGNNVGIGTQPGYTFYNWINFGVGTGGNNNGNHCISGRYGLVERFMHGWMVTADPTFYDWARRTSNHLVGPCTLHWDGTIGDGSQGQWMHYSEGGQNNGEIHGQAFSLGTASSIHNPGWTAWMYMLSAYTPFKDHATKTLDFYMGNFQGSTGNMANAVAGTNVPAQTIREWTWAMEAWLQHYVAWGSATALTYARNVFNYVFMYNHDLLDKPSSTIEGQGGLGTVPVRAGWNSDETFHAQTYASYPADPIKLFHEIGTKANANGQSAVVTSGDLSNAARVLKQHANMCLMGPDGLSPNDASTLANRVSLAAPILRGGTMSAGNARLYGGSYAWRWSDLHTGDTTTVRSSDTGLAAIYSTAIDGTTVTISGSTLTFSAAIPFSLMSGNDVGDMPAGHGLYFYVAGEPTQALRMNAHTGGATTATLSASYGGTTGAGKSFVIAMNGNVSPEIWCTSLDAWAYAAKLYKNAGETSKYTALLAQVRAMYKSLCLYAPVNDATYVDWAVTFADTTRAAVVIGTDGSSERNQSYFTRRSGNFYLRWEYDGNPADSGSTNPFRYTPIRWP